jgi:GrpB-like predicted nucleotidyltransferase (UPF0157 family)
MEPPLGLARGTTVVRPYDERWPREFEREAAALRALLAGLVTAIEHVGSTAVPGLASKPVLDIAIAYPNRSVLAQARRRLVAARYHDRGELGNAGAVFAKGPEHARTHLLHLVPAGSPQWADYLRFRDALRRDAELRERYAALKTELAHRFPSDRAAYLEGKRQLIEAALAVGSRQRGR